jgi:hypothetical protein
MIRGPSSMTQKQNSKVQILQDQVITNVKIMLIWYIKPYSPKKKNQMKIS